MKNLLALFTQHPKPKTQNPKPKMKQITTNSGTIVLTAEEGHKLVNKPYADYITGGKQGTEPPLNICAEAYLAPQDTPDNYEEITEAQAEQWQKEYDQRQMQSIMPPANED